MDSCIAMQLTGNFSRGERFACIPAIGSTIDFSVTKNPIFDLPDSYADKMEFWTAYCIGAVAMYAYEARYFGQEWFMDCSATQMDMTASGVDAPFVDILVSVCNWNNDLWRIRWASPADAFDPSSPLDLLRVYQNRVSP
jgi:hypothetical protein